MRIRQFCGTLALLGSVSLFGTNAQATLVFFNDRTTWENTLGGTITTEDFNAVTPFVLSAGSNPAGLLDITLSNVFGSVNQIGDISAFWLIDGTTGFRGGGSAVGAENIFVNLPHTVFGWGADFSTTHDAGGLTLEIDSILAEFSDLIPGSGQGAGTGFLGVISTNAFSSIRLFDAEQNETFGMDNVSFGDGTFAATAVSEPTALAILGLGFAALGMGRRRRV